MILYKNYLYIYIYYNDLYSNDGHQVFKNNTTIKIKKRKHSSTINISKTSGIKFT